MARTFSGSSLDLSIGGLSGIDGGAITLVAVVRLTSDTGGVIDIRDSGGASIAELNAAGDYYYATRGAGEFVSLLPALTADGWHIIAVTKADGQQTPRGHKYVYATGAWTHTNAGGTVRDSTTTAGVSGSVRLGRIFGDFLSGDLAAVAVWDRVLTDAELEQPSHTLTAWHSAAPAALWVLDQASTGQAVMDATGGGANQIAISGTTVSTSSVPGLGYGAQAMAATVSPSAVTVTGLLAGTAPSVPGVALGAVCAAVNMSGAQREAELQSKDS